jgi:hypothetical protein
MTCAALSELNASVSTIAIVIVIHAYLIGRTVIPLKRKFEYADHRATAVPVSDVRGCLVSCTAL